MDRPFLSSFTARVPLTFASRWPRGTALTTAVVMSLGAALAAQTSTTRPAQTTKPVTTASRPAAPATKPAATRTPAPETAKPAAPVETRPAAQATPATAAVEQLGPVTPFPPDLPDVEARKRRLAIQPFDYATVKAWVHYWFNRDENIGDGIRSHLETQLASVEAFDILNRAKIDAILKEQDFNQSNRVERGTGAGIGQVLGVDTFLVGEIVIFGREDTTKGKTVGGILGTIAGPIFGGLVTLNKAEKAIVGINLKLVDGATSRQIAAASARGESKRESKDWGGVFGVKGVAAAGGAGMSSANFLETIIGEATANAVTEIVKVLEQRVPTVPLRPRKISNTRVARIGAAGVYINRGSDYGVLRGDRFEIFKVEDELRDPQTKEVIGEEAVKVGELVVDNVEAGYAIGKYGGQPLSASYVLLAGKGYSAKLMTK